MHSTKDLLINQGKGLDSELNQFANSISDKV